MPAYGQKILYFPNYLTMHLMILHVHMQRMTSLCEQHMIAITFAKPAISPKGHVPYRITNTQWTETLHINIPMKILSPWLN